MEEQLLTEVKFLVFVVSSLVQAGQLVAEQAHFLIMLIVHIQHY